MVVGGSVGGFDLDRDGLQRGREHKGPFYVTCILWEGIRFHMYRIYINCFC